MTSKRKTVLLGALLSLCVFVMSAPLFAQDQFELTDNGWTYGQSGLLSERLTHDFGFSYFYNAAGSDNVYQNSWWFRTAGDTREYGFSNLITSSAGGNVANLVYEELGSDGLTPAIRLELTYTLVGLNATQAYMKTDWTLTNLTNTLLPVELFAYTDFDVDTDSDDDSAQVVAFGPSSGSIQATDLGSDTVLNIIASGNGLSAWEIAPWPVTRDALTDDLVSTLSSASSPLGPTDLASAFEYSLNIDGGQTVSGSQLLGVNTVPEPGSLLSLMAGIAGLAGIRRFRRR